MRDIGARLGPFDVTMIEVGQYHRAWPDWHIGPEQAVLAHGMVRGRVMLPMHWGLFTLAPHGWTEPIERALAAGGAAGRGDRDAAAGRERRARGAARAVATAGGRRVPWVTAAQDPIQSTKVN